jgi:primosomal protein N' (replication factor Y)
MTLYAHIILPLPLDRTFSYIVPQSLQKKARKGSRVLVPFGQRLLTGFIVDLRKKELAQEFKLKEVMEVLDEEPLFSSSFLSFTRKLGEYYYSSWGELLQSSLPPSFMLRSQTRVALSEKGKVSLQDKTLEREEREILDFLRKGSYSPFFLKRKLRLKNLSSLLARLEKKNLIQVQRSVKKSTGKAGPAPSPGQTQLEMDFSLDVHSRELAGQIAQNIGKELFLPFYLHGPSEKRESIYFYLIREALAAGKKVLFLVPEISPTQTLRGKFEKRLGEKAALLHSRLSERRRELEWRKIREGEADVVVGPRSALFSPLDHLGLLIVDEEQDESFYQQENPCYDARKGAWMRAEQEGAVLVCGSAFPSVSAFHRARKRGCLLSLESGDRRKKVEIVDYRGERRLISLKLEEKIAQRLKKKEAVLIFFNRRGYASSLFCSRCSYIPRCARCDIALSYHKREEKLVCHYCSSSLPKIVDCPNCGSRLIRERGAGVEAVEEELKNIFPQARVACFDTDLSRREQEMTLRRFRSGKIDILLGTQLLAHQADLPPASLVSVLSPETILTLSDYRASQKTFQTLNQMMMFLKNDEEGEVIIQTAFPDHFSIVQAASGDYLSFFRQELRFRRLMNYPPFSHVVEVLFLGESLRSVARSSREFMALVKSHPEDIEILGPALASVSRVRGMNRVQVTLKAQSKKKLDRVLKEALKKAKSRKLVLVYD